MEFGFDIGISNIGWAVFDDENNQFIDAGVRKFAIPENPKTKAALSKARGEAKRKRKTISRKRVRLHFFRKELAKELGVDINTIENNSINNQWQLRVDALYKKLKPLEVAKALYHIAKHRNYDDLKYSIADDEAGKIKEAIKSNEEALKGFASPAEYLLSLKKDNPQLKIRNSEGSYKNSFGQSHIKKEFELIVNTQNKFGYKLDIETLTNLAFMSKELQSFADKVGYCSFFKDEKRNAKNSPSGCLFIAYGRIINKLIEIAKAQGNYDEKTKDWFIIDRDNNRLDTKNAIKDIIDSAMSAKSYKLESLKKALNLEKDFEIPNRGGEKEFLNFEKLIQLKNIAKELKISDNLLDDVSFCLATCKGENALKESLSKLGIEVNDEKLRSLISLNFSGFVDLSAKAIKLILPYLQEGLNYYQACDKADLHALKRDEKFKLLPPLNDYEDYKNAVTSVSVIRSFSQFRLVLNALIEKYGSPSKIYFDLAREVGKNAETRNKYISEQNKNTKLIEEAMSECKKLGLEETSANVLKIRLWLEQDKKCAYSGETIADEMIKQDNLLEKSFIIPLSRSLDSSYNNQVLVFKKENAVKGNKIPYEAFDEKQFERISAFANEVLKKRNYSKYMKLVAKKFENREFGRLAKHLNDTSHIAVLIKSFLEEFLEFAQLKNDKKKHIIAPSGALKSAMRFYLGLGKKEIGNYRRHAIDACVVCLCNDAVIQKFSEFKRDLDIEIYQQTSNELKIALREQDYKIKHGFELGRKYRENIENIVAGVFVSHRKDAHIRGEIHNQTIYSAKKATGALKDALGEGRKILVRGGFSENATGSFKRLDIFKDKITGKYYGCPIYLMDYSKKQLPNRVFIGGGKQAQIDDSLEFCFSLVKNDLILVKTKNMEEPVLCYLNGYNISNNTIAISTHDKKFDSFSESEQLAFKGIDYQSNTRQGFGIVKLEEFKKMLVTSLGKIDEKEGFAPRQNLI